MTKKRTSAKREDNLKDYEIEAVEVVAEGGDSDTRLERAAEDFRRQAKNQDLSTAIGVIIRDAVDYVIDASAMRRYSIDDLEADEKTTIGKRIERLIRMRLNLPKGERLDIRLAGEDVDIKTSCTLARSWMFSKNNVDHINLLIAYDERKAVFDLGFVLVTEDILGARNRDLKRGIIGSRGAVRPNAPAGKEGRVAGSACLVQRSQPARSATSTHRLRSFALW